MLDCQLYGMKPAGHHLTSVLLHTATVILLFLALRQMTGAVWRSAFVAAVFAIHPLRVESVAWVAERKDVLSGLFFMLTVGAYAHYARLPWSLRRYGLVMVLFAMGLMCKPMLVTLPVVLLLLDYWPLRRVGSEKFSALLLEKLPLLALSAASCVATILAQGKAIQSTEAYSLPLRFGNAIASCFIYLGQMVWPAGLAAYYPYPKDGLSPGRTVLEGILLAGLLAVVLWRRQKQSWLLVGWLWYMVMLAPVVGIIQVGAQSHADRYTYLPQIGLYVAMTWLAAEWGGKGKAAMTLKGGVMAATLIALMVCAWKQTTYWANGETLWTHALACTTNNDEAYNGLGVALNEKGRVDEAITYFEKAVEINPNCAVAHSNLGLVLVPKGRLDEAITHCRRALQIRPDMKETYVNLGNALVQKGALDEAMAQYQAALAIDSGYADAHNNLANALLASGKTSEAVAEYQEALRIRPDYADARNNLEIALRRTGGGNDRARAVKPGSAEEHYNLGNALRQKGATDEAIAEYEKALQLNPDYAAAHNNLGTVFLRAGRTDEAISHFQKALQINPGNGQAQNNLGNAYLQKGDAAGAAAHFRQAMQLEPTDRWVKNNLAWLLATAPQASLRDGRKAVELARQAEELAGEESPIILHTLAAAYAEAGQYSQALETARRALAIAGAQSNTRLVDALQTEMELYQAGKPFHIPDQKY